MKQNLSAFEIRRAFLDFFEKRGHRIVPSSPLVLPSDPTLLFANAGMNQFRDIFLGEVSPEARRVADTQKCIRVSGKHNDLEQVGVDTYHHTFFEMLGNWSFGDYYKHEAIAWAWELLVDHYELPRDRLWITVYHDDDEAAELWKRATDVDAARILRFGEKDNFWEMGKVGPCGPCSEIHIDLSPDGRGRDLVNADSPLCVELWNLVFIQFHRLADGSLQELPQKHIDTGMGLERLVAVLQGRQSNYDTDLFRPLIAEVESMSGRSYGGSAADDVAMRVIADHLRGLSFAVADGVLPSNEGRGYVLRRILRRAVRYGRNLDLREPFLCRLAPTLVSLMGDTFPELLEHRDTVKRVLQSEEESFGATLDRGLELFADIGRRVRAAGGKVIPGEEAFRLYDTYGFPLDLTELMAREEDLRVDREGFERHMAAQRERGRRSRRDGGPHDGEGLRELRAAGHGCLFRGYEVDETESRVVGLLCAGRAVDKLEDGQQGEVLLDQTPFYAAAGGQTGDRGCLYNESSRFDVADTGKPVEGLFLHSGTVIKGTLRVGRRLKAAIDQESRRAAERHHTATHLLQYALRREVNGSIRQAGSFVSAERLRFDFSHFEALSEKELRQVEGVVNSCIMQADKVRHYEINRHELQGSDIIAIFDEKYGENVRVLDIGGYSRELCGGTHVRNTGQIGCFRIVAESSVAAGVRRIEAVAGHVALQRARREHETLERLGKRFSVSAEEVETRVIQLDEQHRRLEKELRRRAREHAASRVGEVIERPVNVNGVPLLAADLGDLGMDELRAALDRAADKIDSGVVVLGSQSNGKACFAAAATPDAVESGVHAGKLLSAVAGIAGGGGGGRPDKAQAGGRNGQMVGRAIESVAGLLKEQLAG